MEHPQLPRINSLAKAGGKNPVRATQSSFPTSARWEHNSVLAKLKGGAKTLLGLDRGGRNFRIYPDDIFLVSYPRSGNTWTRFLVANLISNDLPVTFENIEEKIPDPTAVTRRHLAKIPRPRIIKSHEYFDPRYRRVIYIVRDPRDVAVSNYYFQLKKRFIADGYPMDDYISLFVSTGIDAYGSWGENVLSWLATRGSSKDFLLLKYEEMKSDPVSELSKIALFLGIVATQERMARAVELSSAERMRNLEKSQSNSWRTTRNTRQDIPFVRGAITGGWKDTLSDCQVATIEGAWGALMSVLGYEASSKVGHQGSQLTSLIPQRG